MLRAGVVGGVSPIVMTRVAAIVQASVFDAVNGIDRKYSTIHVTANGPAGVSRRAAAVQACGSPKLHPSRRERIRSLPTKVQDVGQLAAYAYARVLSGMEHRPHFTPYI